MTKTGWTVTKSRKDTFKCQDCHKELPVNKSGGTGYALYGEKKICYSCAKDRELKAISKVAPGGKYDFYYSHGRVTNWTGTIVFRATGSRVGRHNMAGTRTDVWFVDHLGREWHGTNIGDNDILRARRLK